MKKIFLYSTLIILLANISCTSKKRKTNVEITIISPSIVSNKNLDSVRYSDKDFSINQNNVVLRFSISNKTSQNYYFVVKNLFDTYNGINTFEGANLDLDFLKIINTKTNEIVKTNYVCSLPMPNNKLLEMYETKNKNKLKQFNNLKYFKSLDWINKSERIKNNLIFLKSNETKFYEVFVNLPYSEASKGCSYVKLNPNYSYNATLKFLTDTTNIKKYLTWSQLQYIKENKYKLYHGMLISKNSVPVKFVE